jgi:molybdopterin/thiamine biosynthesis adenylyltransferase
MNVDSAACEILKNLILAGVGFVGLVDNLIVTEYDLKNNFFVNYSDLNKKRGNVCLENLLELNSDSQGIFYDSSPEEFLNNHLLQFSTYDLIIVSNLNEVSNKIYL